MPQPRSHSLALGLIECAEPGRIDQADACTGLDDGLHTRQVPVPRSIHERRAFSVAARVHLHSALTQECEDALCSTRGSGVQRRPSHFVGEIRGHALGEKPVHRGHVIAIGKVPNVAGAHLVLIAGFSHRRRSKIQRDGDRRLEKSAKSARITTSFVAALLRKSYLGTIAAWVPNYNIKERGLISSLPLDFPRRACVRSSESPARGRRSTGRTGEL